MDEVDLRRITEYQLGEKLKHKHGVDLRLGTRDNCLVTKDQFKKELKEKLNKLAYELGKSPVLVSRGFNKT